MIGNKENPKPWDLECPGKETPKSQGSPPSYLEFIARKKGVEATSSSSEDALKWTRRKGRKLDREVREE